MWDLATLKKLNEQREIFLRNQKAKKESEGKVIPMYKKPEQQSA
jgi:hypothetical protein